jgi:hypothetical protein
MQASKFPQRLPQYNTIMELTFKPQKTRIVKLENNLFQISIYFWLGKTDIIAFASDKKKTTNRQWIINVKPIIRAIK